MTLIDKLKYKNSPFEIVQIDGDKGKYNLLKSIKPDYLKKTPCIDIPEGVNRIVNSLFHGNIVTKQVILPSSLEAIPRFCFSNSNIEEIFINDGPKRIEEFAFQRTNIKSIVIPDTVSFIDKYAFVDNYDLEEVILPNNSAFNTISQESFSNCQSLKKINLPDSITEIEAAAFSHCKVLENITLPKSLKRIYYAAFSDTALNGSIDIPETLLFMSDTAFTNTNIDCLVLPKNAFLGHDYLLEKTPTIIASKEVIKKYREPEFIPGTSSLPEDKLIDYENSLDVLIQHNKSFKEITEILNENIGEER